ncbi:MAG: hypothetical protein PWQ09_630 [Candidatus Cloacimonadota bacterium]|jgi:O-antigen/teichoic acid export membrane protein|nr:hypothetical protein [Candidatus Cloacimonadota bacterium]
MLDRIKTTAKHSIIYSFGNLLTKIIGLILLPLYTSHLSTSDYGMLGILEVTAQFLIIVLGLNIYQAMMRWYAETQSELERKSLVFTSFASLFVLAGIILSLLSLFQKQAAILFFDNSSFSIYFAYLFIWVFLEILNTIPLSLLRLKEKSFLYIGFISFKFVVVLSLNVYFIAYRNMGIKGIILSQLLGSLILFIMNLPILLNNFKLKFRFQLLKQMFAFSFPLIFSSISVMLLAMGDRFIIKYFLDYSEVGIYSLAYKIAGVINVFIINSFSLSFLPIAYKAFNTEGAREFYKKVFKYFSFILIFSALALSLFAKEILQIFARNPAYWEAANLAPLLTLAFVFKGTQYILGLGFHYIKKTKYNAYIVMSGVVLNFGFNFLLIPVIGIWGAAVATIISGLYITVVYYFKSKKYYDVGYKFGKVLEALTLAVIIYLLSLFIPNIALGWTILGKLILLSMFPLILLTIGFYDKQELVFIKKIIKKRLPNKQQPL